MIIVSFVLSAMTCPIFAQSNDESMRLSDMQGFDGFLNLVWGGQPKPRGRVAAASFDIRCDLNYTKLSASALAKGLRHSPKKVETDRTVVCVGTFF